MLYTGMRNNLEHRVAEHKTHLNSSFTDQYNVTILLYFESFDTSLNAIAREKQIKNWSRSKKKALIDRMNPEWNDLSLSWSVA